MTTAIAARIRKPPKRKPVPARTTAKRKKSHFPAIYPHRVTLTPMRSHFKTRLKERYGIEPIDADIEIAILSLANRGISPSYLIHRQSRRFSIWGVRIVGEWVRVVYDNLRHDFISALDPDLTPAAIRSLRPRKI